MSIQLQQNLINNTRLITDRESLFNILPKRGNIAEIGVAHGKNSISMLSSNPTNLHLFDINLTHVSDSDKALLNKLTTVHYYEGNDLELLQDIPDNFFDWVYLDSLHLYDHTWKELEILKTKVKSGGYICGHDYVTFDYRFYKILTEKKGRSVEQAMKSSYYNLRQCVNKFCNDNQFELAYLTTELHPSFAIQV